MSPTRDLAMPEKAKDHGWNSVGELDFAKLPTLPELIVGQAEGRQSDREITCFLNNIGLGYQFAAAGSVVYPQGQGRRLRPRAADRLVHRRRAPISCSGDVPGVPRGPAPHLMRITVRVRPNYPAFLSRLHGGARDDRSASSARWRYFSCSCSSSSSDKSSAVARRSWRPARR